MKTKVRVELSYLIPLSLENNLKKILRCSFKLRYKLISFDDEINSFLLKRLTLQQENRFDHFCNYIFYVHNYSLKHYLPWNFWVKCYFSRNFLRASNQISHDLFLSDRGGKEMQVLTLGVSGLRVGRISKKSILKSMDQTDYQLPFLNF